MLNRAPRPSFKQGNGAAKAASAISRGGKVPMKDVAARLGFKRTLGKPKKPTFEFQEALKTASTAELAQRRQLMKNVAARVYNQMGFSVRTHEMGRATLLWFNQYRETLPVAGDERDIADRLATRMGDILEEFLRIRKEKVSLADELETALTQTKRDHVLARAKKMAETEADKNRKGVESLMPEEDHPETTAPGIIIDPELILEHAKSEILSAEKEKKILKNPRKKAVKSDEENE